MILKKVKIYNYRQLQKVELDLQNSLTVLAGPNNSGKTTLISVLKGMFRDKKLSFTYSDIPTNLSTSWVEKIIPVFQSIIPSLNCGQKIHFRCRNLRTCFIHIAK